MSSVGIIANPRAGKDIRRLVAHGSILDTQEKVYIVRRALLGLEGAGVKEVVFMPDPSGIGIKALSGIDGQLKLQTRFLDMFIRDDASDSTRAGKLMYEQGARCLIVIGGDGTNRAVAKNCGPLPLVSISTGTNNAFPHFLESTLAGLAAGLYATRSLSWETFTLPCKRLNLYRNGILEDIALIDAAVCDYQFVGARALWEVPRLKEVFLTQGTPMNMGLASIGGMVHPISPRQAGGLHLTLGEDGTPVTVAIAPGLIVPVGIRGYQLMNVETRFPVSFKPSILALDGERELMVNAQDTWEVALTWDGPRVLNTEKVLETARSFSPWGSSH
jgi:predicted polyphosphate/ATP-dependent NAD kinase